MRKPPRTTIARKFPVTVRMVEPSPRRKLERDPFDAPPFGLRSAGFGARQW